MTNDKPPEHTEGASRGSWPRRAEDVKIEIGFGVPLGAMSAHPVFRSAWDIGW